MAGTWTHQRQPRSRCRTTGPAEMRGAGAIHVQPSMARASASMSIADDCQVAADDSRSQPLAAARHRPRATAARTIVRTAGTAKTPLRAAKPGAGRLAVVQGPRSVRRRDKQNLPDTWNPATGENILWRTPIPGLAHSSPIVWGDTIFVTSAISSKRQRDVQARTLRRRRCIRRSIAASLDALRDRQAHRQDPLGARPRRRASRATSATSSRPTRAPRPPPTAGSSSRGSDRRASTPTTSTADCDGRSISAASTWAPTTFPPTSGDRRARRSSGTAW